MMMLRRQSYIINIFFEIIVIISISLRYQSDIPLGRCRHNILAINGDEEVMILRRYYNDVVIKIDVVAMRNLRSIHIDSISLKNSKFQQSG